MQNYYNLLIFLLSLTFVISACTLDKEPTAPNYATNETAPIFISTEITANTHDSVCAKARLSSLGNLTVLHYGWVWSENPGPTLADKKQESGLLGVKDSFSMLIAGLNLGKTYYFRPYVITGSGETYGPEKIIFMGIPRVNELILLENSACFLKLRCNLQSPIVLSEYGLIYLRGTGTPTLQKNDGHLSGMEINNDSFELELKMLNPNTTYSVRAYAITAAGVGYSQVLMITTPTNTTMTANFGFNTDAEIFQEAIVQFINKSNGATKFNWSFGDGNASTAFSPTHTFNMLGNMKVQLIAENANGCMMTKDTIIKVVANPFKDYWVEVEGGTFMMGCTSEQEPNCGSDEKPVHAVTLSSFFIGKTEITQRQWKAVLGNNPSNFYYCLDCPVETVFWSRIVNDFVPALNRKTGQKFRLPTEAEWEFAGRGGNKSKGYKYAGGNNLDSVAWHFYNADGTTHPVGRKIPNELGLYDMSGNVMEWCKDWYSENYYSVSPSNDPTGPLTGNYRILRGSAFGFIGDEFRLSNRQDDNPNAGVLFFGFRLVQD